MRNYYRNITFIIIFIMGVLIDTTALFQIGTLSKAVNEAAFVSVPIFLVFSLISPIFPPATLAPVDYLTVENSSNESIYRNAFCLYIYKALTRVVFGTLFYFFTFCSGCCLLTILLCAYYFFYSN